MSVRNEVRGCADRSGQQIVRSAAMSFLIVTLAGCGSESPNAEQPPSQTPPEKLSQYGLFIGSGVSQEPAEGVIPYDLNSALFSDYALKYRFFKLPPGTHATYSDSDAFGFPIGTVIAKTFAYPRDAARSFPRTVADRDADSGTKTRWLGRLALHLECRAD